MGLDDIDLSDRPYRLFCRDGLGTMGHGHPPPRCYDQIKFDFELLHAFEIRKENQVIPMDHSRDFTPPGPLYRIHLLGCGFSIGGLRMMSNAIHPSDRIVENVFLFIGAIAVFLLVLITFLMIFFVLRYHRKRHPHPKDIQGHIGLEIIWTVVPTLIVLSMFYYGLKGFQSLRKIPEDALKVKVTARQWSWLFEYENGLKTSEFRVPVGRAIHLSLSSQDVIHSFYVPAFKVKQDAVPGMINQVWFRPMETGVYDVLCAEYCGIQHSYMMTKVIVLPENEFKQWYEERGVREAKLLLSGQRLFEERGCKSCHSVDGSQLAGPTVKGLFGKMVTVLAEGRERQVKADELYLKKSILEPNSEIVKGFPPIMPSQKGLLREEEIDEIINYLKGLK